MKKYLQMASLAFSMQQVLQHCYAVELLPLLLVLFLIPRGYLFCCHIADCCRCFIKILPHFPKQRTGFTFALLLLASLQILDLMQLTFQFTQHFFLLSVSLSSIFILLGY